MRDNYAFFRKFRVSPPHLGEASFNYENGGGERILGEPEGEFKTRWTNRGQGSIYALDYNFHVALAKHCTNFEQIDDPGQWYEDSSYIKPVNEGEIVVFRNERGFALIKILSFRMRTPTSNAELHFHYELRYA